MKKLAEIKNEKPVIPLRNAVAGIDVPHWSIETANDLEKFLSGDAADRLFEFESIGYTPKAIAEMVENTETRTLTWFEHKFGIGAGRMMTLAEADREGRLKVFPFKAGDHVWINGLLGVCEAEEHVVTSVSCHFWEKTDVWFNAEMVRYRGEARCSFGLDDIGKFVFRTKEEAEAALREKVQD